jgi:hypothetical protein
VKPSKSVVKTLTSDIWGFPHYHAIKVFDAGWVSSCDSCGGLILNETCPKEYKDRLTEESFGMTKDGIDVCYYCRKSPRRIAVEDLRGDARSPVKGNAIDVKACPYCEGKAAVPCKVCVAAGWIGCPSCDAAGGTLCTDCNGWAEKEAECKRCKGRGTEPGFRGAFLNKKCRDCFGTKTKSERCFSCEGKGRKDECNKCDATGEVDCPNCSGNGQLPCPECKGYGRPIPKSVV